MLSVLAAQEISWLAASVSQAHPGSPAGRGPLARFTENAIPGWAKDYLAPAGAVCPEGLACFVDALTRVGCSHHPTVIAGAKPRDVPACHQINADLGNFRAGVWSCHHAFAYPTCATRYLAAFRYGFNRRYDRSSGTNRCLTSGLPAH
jgi:hypothetical protein